MKYYRIFLLSFVTFSGVFSIGIAMPVDADTATIEKPKTVFELKSVEVEKTHIQLETSPVNKKKQTSANAKKNIADKSKTSDYSELQKPLDLSIPEKDLENADLETKQNMPAQNPETNIFTPETIKKSRPLQLNGNFLMSPEPEAGKQKSVDGAGIVINLKP